MWHHSWTPEFGIKVFALNLAISYCLFTLYLQTAVLWVTLSCPLQMMAELWTQHTSININWNSSVRPLVSGPSRALLNKKETRLLIWDARPGAQFSVSPFCGLNLLRSRILQVASLSLWSFVGESSSSKSAALAFQACRMLSNFLNALGPNFLIWKGFVLMILMHSRQQGGVKWNSNGYCKLGRGPGAHN